MDTFNNNKSLSIRHKAGGYSIWGPSRYSSASKKDGDEKESVQDDDEDKKNPQYIPKKGMFYEHDNRYLQIE